jgi:ArsR family transcriptional regulator
MKNDYHIELFLRALSDRTRLRVINLMDDTEICVCTFVEVLKTNQPKVSRHLAYLKRAGLVTARREGKWMHYRLSEPSDPYAANMLRQIREWSRNNSEMRDDKLRLELVVHPLASRSATVPYKNSAVS